MSYVINNDLFTTTINSFNNQSEEQFKSLTHQHHQQLTDGLFIKNENFLNCLIKTLKQLAMAGLDCQIRKISHKKVNILISVPFVNIQKHFLLINFQIDTQYGSLKTHTKIFTQNRIIITINTKHQRILLNKLIMKHESQIHPKTLINLQNFQLLFSLPYFCFIQGQQQKQKNEENKHSQLFYDIINSTVKKVQKQCQVLYQKIIRLFQIDNNFSPPTFLQQSTTKKIPTSQILRYIHRSSIQPVFDISIGSSKYDKIENLENNEEKQINSLLKNIDYEMREFYQSIKLFKYFDMFFQNCLKKIYTKDYFMLSDHQQQHLKQRIQNPLSSGKLNSVEPKFVYNIIQLHQPKNIQLKKILTGGFSQIFKSDVKFWYMMTVSNDKMQRMQKIFKEKEILNKSLQNLEKQIQKRSIIRKIVQKSIVFKTSPTKQRIFHQQQIVSKFKNVSTIFLPEYYKCHQKSQQQFQSYIMMQHLPFPTLNQYVEINKFSVSFLTKIHLMLMIAQGLKVLKDCEIVHLDLKPSNCIVTKRLIVKLIDFGESFCKQLCNNQEKYFKPAFTIPYGSPQIITNHQHPKPCFTQKSDIFSWSIMLFQLIFETLPFTFSKHLIHEKYHNGLYMSDFFYVSQQEQNYGQKELPSLLRLLVMKGLSMEQNKRSYCNWAVIILQECLKYLVGLQNKWNVS